MDSAVATATRRPKLSAPPLRRRLACLIYDGLILLGVALFTAALVVFVLHAFGVEHNPRLLRPVMQWAEFGVLTAYGTWFWSANRQTLPMKTWRIRVVTTAGGPLSPGRALWRALLSWLWILPALALSAALQFSPRNTGLLLCVGLLLWAASSLLRKDRQFLHDTLAGTRLISTES
ncbi:MAG: RDD family protein [Thiomonas sp.]|nr:RDD family protein [Thiomonas sp.]